MNVSLTVSIPKVRISANTFTRVKLSSIEGRNSSIVLDPPTHYEKLPFNLAETNASVIANDAWVRRFLLKVLVIYILSCY